LSAAKSLILLSLSLSLSLGRERTEEKEKEKERKKKKNRVAPPNGLVSLTFFRAARRCGWVGFWRVFLLPVLPRERVIDWFLDGREGGS
jgi:hypothetical protein